MTPPVGTSEGCHIRAQACDSRLCVLLYSMQIRPHCRRHPDFTLRYRRAQGLFLYCSTFLFLFACNILLTCNVPTEWYTQISKVLLRSTGNYIQHPLIDHNGNKHEKE